MTHTEELARRLARPKEKRVCGLCLSCRRRETCQTGFDWNACASYLPTGPTTKAEWSGIYRKAYAESLEPCSAHESVMRIGRVNALRDAMTRIHGFGCVELEELENDCRQNS